MMAKYSGNTINLAPCSAAILIKRSASLKLAATLGPEAICMPAIFTIPAAVGVAFEWLVLDLMAILYFRWVAQFIF